jgi:hypothetical protein
MLVVCQRPLQLGMCVLTDRSALGPGQVVLRVSDTLLYRAPFVLRRGGLSPATMKPLFCAPC